MLSNIKLEGVTPMRRLIEKFPEVAKVKKKEREIYSSEVFLSLGLISFIVFGKRENPRSGIIIVNQIICYLA